MAVRTPGAIVSEPDISEDERLALQEVRSLDDAEGPTTPVASTPPPMRTPVVEAKHGFDREAVFQTWRVVARNPNYAGETEGFQFGRGEAVVPALPSGASEERVETRLLRLNNLQNYPFSYRAVNQRTKRIRTVTVPGYEVMSEAEYEARFGDRDDDYEAIDEL